MGGLFAGGGGSKQPASSTSPQIASWRVQTSLEGMCIALVYGRTRVPGNIIQAEDFTAVAMSTGGGGGAAGGKGGGSPAGGGGGSTTYYYHMGVIWGLCEGPINRIDLMWADKRQWRYAPLGGGAAPPPPDYWPAGKKLPKLFHHPSVVLGERPQDPAAWMVSKHPARALGYFGLAYIHDPLAGMGDSAALPNWSFEVYGLLPFSEDIPEANPADIIPDFLSNPFYGAGFPGENIGDLGQLSDYCVASGLFLAPAYQEQKETREHLADLLKLVNSQVVMAEEYLDIVPLGDEEITGNGVTFTPDLTPQFDLDEDDFIFEEGQMPVEFIPASYADVYNSVTLEYLDRQNSYNIATSPPTKDLASIQAYGLRKMDTILAHAINNTPLAKQVSQNILQYCLYARNTLRFKLGLIGDLLKPLEWVTITSAALGLDHLMVRIQTITEEDGLCFTIEALEWPLGTAHAALYPTQEKAGTELNYNVDPGHINPPVIFEPPALLTTTGLEVWVAASGGEDWGGAEVWASFDNATYQRVGNITNPARTGKLSAQLASGADPDTAHTLAVDLTESRGELLSGTQEEVDARATLCFVDRELIAYKTATLTDAHKYGLTYLRRGCYGTAIAAHAANGQFARLDGAVFKYTFREEQIGQTLYLKFLSRNTCGGALEALEDVEPYQYLLGNSGGLEVNLPTPQNLVDSYIDGRVVLHCDKVDDPLKNYRSLDYEWRYGALFNTASVIGRTQIPQITTIGDGTYWVATHYGSSYSTPASIVITGAALPANVVQTYDEKALGWPGTMTGGVFVDGSGNLQIAVDTTFPYSGAYEIPSGHVVNLGALKPCGLSQSYLSQTVDPTGDFDSYADVDAVADIDSLLAGYADVKVQIAISTDGSTYGAWRDFVAGQYQLWKVKWRLLFSVLKGPSTPVVSVWNYTTDMPDRVESVPVIACAAGGLAVTFTPPFQAIPAVAPAILNAQAGDIGIFLVQPTVNGYTYQVQNGGVGVGRNLSLIHKGY